MPTIEETVAGLVTATNELITEVSIKKVALDNAEATAIASATDAAASAASIGDTENIVLGYKDAAETAKTDAAASAALASAITLGVASGRPSIQPTLNLDFVNQKSLDPRIDFARASIGTYYDEKTTVKAEENLFTNSENFDPVTDWLNGATSITVNSTVAPDGTATADLVTASATTGVHTLHQLVPFIAGENHIFSVYAKANGSQYLQMMYPIQSGNNNAYANFDLINGTVTLQGSETTPTITDEGNGWYRCTISAPRTLTAIASAYMLIIPAANTIRYDVNADGTGLSLYVWGAQFERRDTLTVYTPTTTQPITNYIPVLQTANTDEARLDYDPITRESKGLLIEDQSTNLVTYSENITATIWTVANLKTAYCVLPNGAIGENIFIPNTTTSQHYLTIGNAVLTAGVPVCKSLYVKDFGAGKVGIHLSTATFIGDQIVFNFDTETITDSGGDFVSWGFEKVGNGWYRIWGVATPDTSTTDSYYISLGNLGSYLGDGYNGIAIWGVQMENSTFPTSYIPTNSTQVTRSKENASITGTNFSDFYNQEEGSIYTEASFSGGDSLDVIANRNIWQFTGDNVPSGFIHYNRNGNLGFYSFDGDFNIGDTVVYDVGEDFKSVIGLNSNGIFAVHNNLWTGVDTSYYPKHLTTLHIGSKAVNTGHFSGHIKKLAYYPKRLVNAELQAITEG